MAEKNGRLTRHNGAAIREFRIKAGYKPGEFAAKAQVAYSTLDNLEKERKEASLEVLHRIASVLLISPEAIVRNPAFLIAAPAAAEDVA